MSGEKTEIRDTEIHADAHTDTPLATHTHKSEATAHSPQPGGYRGKEREANNNTYTKVIHTANYTCPTLKLHAHVIKLT